MLSVPWPTLELCAPCFTDFKVGVLFLREPFAKAVHVDKRLGTASLACICSGLPVKAK